VTILRKPDTRPYKTGNFRAVPYGLYVHGASDTGGAVRAVESITTGLQWRAVRPPVTVTGSPGRKDLEACWELGALLAAEVAG